MTDEPTSPPPAGWQQRTVERSLKAARDRAISTGDKFIAAAVELLRTNGKPDFTVQEVVERSGMSLRSFYHHFATKDDLLLALIEETISRYIDAIRPAVAAAAGDPEEQLAVLLREMFGDERREDPASRGLVLFHWHLADTRTEEFAATLRPQVELLIEILTAGVETGVFRTDIPVPALASLVNHTVLSLLEMRVLGVQVVDTKVRVDDLVAFCTAAVAPPPPAARAAASKRPARKR